MQKNQNLLAGSKIQINKKIQKYNQSFTYYKDGRETGTAEKSIEVIDVEPDYGST